MKNFGQPHMVAEVHLRKLREFKVRWIDAANLMDFNGRLEDVKKALTTMGLVMQLVSVKKMWSWHWWGNCLMKAWNENGQILLVILSNPRAR